MNTNKAQYSGMLARKAWDNGDSVKALDYYKEALDRTERMVEEVDKKVNQGALDLTYKRITMGNSFGMRANITSAMTKIILDHSTSHKDLSKNELLNLIKYIWDAYCLSQRAFETNPEWNQYLKGQEINFDNLKEILKENKHLWADLYVKFENEKEFIKLMKIIDPKQTNKLTSEYSFQDNKLVKLWSIGSFFLLAFGFIITGLTIVSNVISSSWLILLVFIFAEVFLLIIGAFVIRTTGDLTEASFLKLINMALNQQFGFLRRFNQKS